MSEIDFLAVSAILMIISDFAWHWLLNSVHQLQERNENHILKPLELYIYSYQKLEV